MNINVSCKDDCAEIKIITTITEDLIMEHEVDTSSNKTRGKFLKLSLVLLFRQFVAHIGVYRVGLVYLFGGKNSN